MPNVGGKTYAYTKSGMKAAAQARKKTSGKKVMRADYMKANKPK